MDWFYGKDLELQKAIDADSAEGVQQAIREGASLNAKGVHRVNPVEYAVGHFRKAAFAELLKQVRIRAQRDEEQNNAMVLATRAYVKDRDYLTMALKPGGDPNTGSQIMTPSLCDLWPVATWTQSE